MTVLTQKNTEQVNDHAQNIKHRQRYHTRVPRYHQQCRMYQTHDGNRKQKGVMYNKM